MQHLTYIPFNVSNINQFHLKTSELLSEIKALTKTVINWRRKNFDNTRNRVIILAWCSALHIYLLMFQISINSTQKHLSYCQKTILKTKTLLHSTGDNFDNTSNRVIILTLCSALHIYVLMFQVSNNSIQNHISYCQKT